MNNIIRREYDVMTDSKNRVALHSPQYDFFHVREYADGRIILEPQIPKAAPLLGTVEELFSSLKERMTL